MLFVYSVVNVILGERLAEHNIWTLLAYPDHRHYKQASTLYHDLIYLFKVPLRITSANTSKNYLSELPRIRRAELPREVNHAELLELSTS